MSALSGISSMMAASLSKFSRQITIRTVTPGAYDPVTLSRAASSTADYQLTANRNTTQSHTIGGGGGAKDAATYRYIFRAADLNGGASVPDLNDQIIDDGMTLRITRVDKAADSLGWIVIAQVGK